MFSGCEQFAHVLIVLSMLAVCFIKIDTKVGIDVKFGSCFFSMDLHKTNKRRKNTASCTSRVVFCRLRAQGDTKLKNEFFYLCMLPVHTALIVTHSRSRGQRVCVCVSLVNRINFVDCRDFLLGTALLVQSQIIVIIHLFVKIRRDNYRFQ